MLLSLCHSYCKTENKKEKSRTQKSNDGEELRNWKDILWKNQKKTRRQRGSRRRKIRTNESLSRDFRVESSQAAEEEKWTSIYVSFIGFASHAIVEVFANSVLLLYFSLHNRELCSWSGSINLEKKNFMHTISERSLTSSCFGRFFYFWWSQIYFFFLQKRSSNKA